MIFRKTILLAISLVMMTQGAFASSAEVATPSSQNSATLKTGDAIWINGLCKRITNSGTELVSPFMAAITACPKLRDYTKVKNAYDESTFSGKFKGKSLIALVGDEVDQLTEEDAHILASKRAREICRAFKYTDVRRFALQKASSTGLLITGNKFSNINRTKQGDNGQDGLIAGTMLLTLGLTSAFFLTQDEGKEFKSITCTR